jgi:serine/threonine-protein kinase HipA
MSLAGKTDDFEIDDLLAFGRFADLKANETKAIIGDIGSALANWGELSLQAGVPPEMSAKARNGFRSL